MATTLIRRKIEINVAGNTENDIKKAIEEACGLLISGCISSAKEREGYKFDLTNIDGRDPVESAPMTEQTAALYKTAKFTDEVRLEHYECFRKRLPDTSVFISFHKMGKRAVHHPKEPLFATYRSKDSAVMLGFFYASELQDFTL